MLPSSNNLLPLIGAMAFTLFHIGEGMLMFLINPSFLEKISRPLLK